MATTEACRAALERLAANLAAADEKDRQRAAFDRTLSCHLTDLGVTFSGRLDGGHIVDITTVESPKAQIRLTTTSDDLLAMTDGNLGFGSAWLSGRVKVEGSFRDLLKLRSML